MTTKITQNDIQMHVASRAMKDEKFRQKLLTDPKAAVAEEVEKLAPGTKIPEGLQVKVVEQQQGTLHLVIPAHAKGAKAQKVSEQSTGPQREGYIFSGIVHHTWLTDDCGCL